MIKCYCDRCGAEIDESISPYLLEFKLNKIRRHLNFPEEFSKIQHLCGPCSDTLNEWIGEKDEIH